MTIDITKVFEEYNVLIYKYLYVRIGYDQATAEDLAQEVFIKAFRNREQYDSIKASVKTWLFVITRTILIDYFRSNKQKLAPIEEVSSDSTIIEEVETDIKQKEVLIKLRELSVEEQELLTLRYMNELSIREVSKVIGKTEGATKVSVHRALGKLRDKFINR